MEIAQIIKNESGIYCIQNIMNQKRYVGSTKQLRLRLLTHRALLRKGIHENKFLMNAWNKYGERNFICFVLEKCDKDILREREQYYVDTLSCEYNLIKEVERHSLSQESRKQLSETRKERISQGLIDKTNTKKIYQYSLEGEFLKEFNTIVSACKETGISHSSICRHLNGTYNKAGNYLWSLKKVESLSPYILFDKTSVKNSKAQSVIVKDSQNREEFIFDSIRECARYFNVSYQVILHVLKHSKLYKKRFIIDYK